MVMLLPRRILSGMRPTGVLHLGHYHGVLKNWTKLQNDPVNTCYFFIADWHALTTHYNSSSAIKKYVSDMLVDWLAAGVDPSKATIFVQSQVPEHAELFLLLSMTTPLSWLERVPTYKEQQTKLVDKDLTTFGFLGYPLLQAADILIYQATHVPVGEDQVPHVEITREIARRFNHIYKPVLTEPLVLLTKESRMPGVDGQKMSKSYNNTIALRDSADVVKQKIRKMPTDPARVRRTDVGNPTQCPVWALHQIYSDTQSLAEINEGCRKATIGCVDCKAPLIQAIIKEQEPFMDRADMYIKNPIALRNILDDGCQRARRVAQETLCKVREAMK